MKQERLTFSEASKKCFFCKKVKNIEDFPHFSTSSAGRKNTCKRCSNYLKSVRNKLKKENPPPNAGCCPICKSFTESWVLDHCHSGDNFRGYICNNCNLGLGKFNDDIAILKNAIKYLSESS